MTDTDATACCAHLAVQYAPMRHADGTASERWECCDCREVFVPARRQAAQIERLSRERDEARAALAEAQKDVERMNWLDKTGADSGHGFCGKGYGEYHYYVFDGDGMPSEAVVKRKTERERFEAWACGSGMWLVTPLGYGTYKKRRYDYNSMETAWRAWQAAKRQARKR